MIGEPRDAGDVGERQRQPELAGATPGSGHAGNRGRLLLPVPAAISHIRAVDYSEQRRGGRTHRGRGLLQRAQFLSHHALHQLGHQSHPVQRHVVQISVGLPESPRLFVAPQTAAAPPEPSEYVQHDDDNVCHDGHFQLGCSRRPSPPRRPRPPPPPPPAAAGNGSAELFETSHNSKPLLHKYGRQSSRNSTLVMAKSATLERHEAPAGSAKPLLPSAVDPPVILRDSLV